MASQGALSSKTINRCFTHFISRLEIGHTMHLMIVSRSKNQFAFSCVGGEGLPSHAQIRDRHTFYNRHTHQQFRLRTVLVAPRRTALYYITGVNTSLTLSIALPMTSSGFTLKNEAQYWKLNCRAAKLDGACGKKSDKQSLTTITSIFCIKI